jgi:hypothetical protein
MTNTWGVTVMDTVVRACIDFSTSIVNALITFFALYMFAGTEFCCGNNYDKRHNRTLKLWSDQPYLAFRMSNSSAKYTTV